MPNIKIKFSRKRLLHPASIGIMIGLVAIGFLYNNPLLQAKVRIATPALAAPEPTQTATTSAAAPSTSTRAVVPAKPVDHLAIKSIGLDAPLMSVGLTKAGALDTPKTMWQVGLYTGGAKPGDIGNAIIVGHSGAPGQRGIFENIDKLKAGQTITYNYVGGRSVTFEVTSSQAYPENQDSANALFATTATPTLSLVSCWGNWNAKTQDYDQRWIVKAKAL